MKNKKVKRFKSLRAKLLTAVVVFSLILSVSVCAVNFYNRYTEHNERTLKFLFWNLKYTISYELTDNRRKDISDLSYINSEEGSTEYQNFKYADKAKEEMGFTRMYIFTTDEDESGGTYIYEAGDSSTKARKGDKKIYSDIERDILMPKLLSDGIVKYIDKENLNIIGWIKITNDNGDNLNQSPTDSILVAEISLKDGLYNILRELRSQLLVAAALIATAGVMLAAYISRRVVRPIEHLVKQVRDFTIGNSINYTAEIKTGDETQILSDALFDMAISINTHVLNMQNDAAEKERVASETRMAQRIEKSLMPAALEVPDLFSAAGLHHSFKGAGGSFYDFFMIDDKRLCVVNAQVSGVGIHIAMYMAVAITTIKSHMMTSAGLTESVNMLNTQLYETFPGETMLSAFIGILEIHTGDFSYINAGNSGFYIVRDDDRSTLGAGTAGVSTTGVEAVHAKRRVFIPIAKEQNVAYKQTDIKLRSGDKLLLCTENLERLKSLKGEFYDSDKMKNMLKKSFCKKAAPQLLLRYLSYELLLNTRRDPQVSDAALLSLQYVKLNKDRNDIVVSAKAESLGAVLELIKKQLRENGLGGSFYAETVASAEELFMIAIHRQSGSDRRSGYNITARCFVTSTGAEVKFLYGGKLENPFENSSEMELDAITFIESHGGIIRYEVSDRNNCVSFVKCR